MTLQLSGLRFARRFILSLALIFTFLSIYDSIGFADTESTFDMPLPSSPVSHTDGSFAPLINPAFSDVSPATSFTYRLYSYEHKTEGNHLFLINMAGFSFSYIWYNNLYNQITEEIEPVKSKLFRIGKGFFFGNMFGFGLDYYFSKGSNSDYNQYKSFALGLLFRPVSFISFGYVTRDVNNPKMHEESVKRSEIYSLSVRPYRDIITLSFDAKRWEGEKFNKSDFLFSANLRLKYDISLFASSDIDRNITFGITIPFGTQFAMSSSAVLDGYASNNNGSPPNFSTFGATLTEERYKSSLTVVRRLLRINIKNRISELETEGFFKKKRLIFYDILNAIRMAGDDDTISGIILKIDRVALGFAQVQELRDELRLFKSRGKRIHSILTASGNKEYYLASISSEISFAPSSSFWITGLSAEVYFFKKLLEKIGVKYESVSKGKYKSFNESFTRDHISREHRENLISLLTDLNEQYLSDIMMDRNIVKEKVDELFGKGILSPGEALDAGFIDAIDYPGDAEKKILDNYGFTGLVVNLKDYSDEKRRIYEWGAIPEIAVIYVSGAIIKGKSTEGKFVFPGTVGDETYKRAIYRAFKDWSVKAVIIRVDSPGGSAVASDFMWHYLIQMKKRFPDKPVIFSFGNVAASGGYFISSTGDTIFADRGSITGSIGVVFGKISLKGLYEKLGINKDIIKMSEFADLFSESKDLTDKERKVIQDGIDFTYRRFTDKVVKYRGIKREGLPEVAEGRVFTGNQANGNRLVDNIGGMFAALSFAKERANIEDHYNVLHLPKRKAPIMGLLGLLDDNNSGLLLPNQLESILRNIDWMDFEDEHAVYYFPYRVVIK